MKQFIMLLVLAFSFEYAHAQAGRTMNAEPDVDAYCLIESYGYGIEVPDCGDPQRHITSQFDSELGKNVFAFTLHAKLDDDRCGAKDRQRAEIKTWGPSPESMKGFLGTQQTYIWKFKLDKDFQPTPRFTHIHQIKADIGPNANLPLVTITPCIKGGKEVLQLAITAQDRTTTVLAEMPLSKFKGVWVEATETIVNGHQGKIETTLRRVSDGKVLLYAKKDNVDLWREGAGFTRPKYGIYRSLLEPSYMRDETVLFADIEFINAQSDAEKVAAQTAHWKIFNARDYGIIGDGKTIDSPAIQGAIEACAADGGGTVVIPPGKYLASTLTLKEGVHLYIDKNAALIHVDKQSPLIIGTDANSTGIDGEGTIDGKELADYLRQSGNDKK